MLYTIHFYLKCNKHIDNAHIRDQQQQRHTKIALNEREINRYRIEFMRSFVYLP